MNLSHRHLLPLLFLLLSAFIWGVSTPITKLAISQFPPLSLAFFRFLTATILMAVITIKFDYHTPIRRADFSKLALIGILAPGLNISLGFLGLAYATALDSIIFAALSTVFIAMAGAIFLKEGLSRLNFLGQVLALGGAVVAIAAPNGNASNRLLGDVLLAISGLAWVAQVILSKELFHRYHSFTITSVMFLVGTIFLAPLAGWEYLANPNWINQVSWSGWLTVLFLAVFTSVIAYLSFEWALERSTASFASLIEYFQLLVGAVMANLLLGEPLSSGFVGGTALLLFGIALATRPAHHYRKAHRH